MLARLLRNLFAGPSRRAPVDPVALAVRAFNAGDLAKAIALCEPHTRDPAAQSAADLPDAWFLLGMIREQQNATAEAARCYRQAARLRPTEGLFDFRLGQLLQASGASAEQRAEAQACLERALAHLDARQEEARQAALASLTRLALTAADAPAARAWARRAAAMPQDTAARIRELLVVPTVMNDVQEIAALRREFEERATALLDDLRAPVEAPERSIGMTPFYFAYHGVNDRALMALLGRVVRAAYAEARPAQAPPPAPRRSGRLRVGFVSTYFYSHSITRTTIGLVRGLPRDAFEVFTFSIAPKQDAMARMIAAASDHHRDLPGDLAVVREAIRDAALDVVFFADLGMSPLTWYLAYWRLAPLQMTTWGHPVTTGIDTVDCFLSNAALETAESPLQFTERLLTPGGFFMPAYERPAVPAVPGERGAFGFSADEHLYLCAQPLFKLHPDIDAAFGAILERDPRATIVLLESDPAWAQVLRARLERHLGTLAGRVRFAPRLDHQRFLQLQQCADVLLEAFHFGSTNAAFEAFALGKAPLTLPSGFQRTRYTAACYAEMEMSAFVPRSAEDYVGRAIRLATEPDYREQIERTVRERCAVLYERPDAARNLAGCLRELCDERATRT